MPNSNRLKPLKRSDGIDSLHHLARRVFRRGYPFPVRMHPSGSDTARPNRDRSRPHYCTVQRSLLGLWEVRHHGLSSCLISGLDPNLATSANTHYGLTLQTITLASGTMWNAHRISACGVSRAPPESMPGSSCLQPTIHLAYR